MKTISNSKTKDIIQSLNSSKSYGNISIEHRVSRSTVYRIDLKTKRNRTDFQICDKKNLSGRPKKLSERDERIILRFIQS